MPVPYSFKNASGTIPLSQLDDNFAVTALSADLAAPAGASSIGIVPTPTIASTTVADAINELDTEKATVTSLTSGLALKTNIADLATTTGAGLVGITPAGNISSTTVATALNELDTEKASLAVLAATTGASLVGFKQSGTGSVTRTIDAKEKETISVLDFGADPTGATSSTAALQLAINYAASVSKCLRIPSGTYTITASGSTISSRAYGLLLPSNLTMVGDSESNTIFKAGVGADLDILTTPRLSSVTDICIKNLTLDGSAEGTNADSFGFNAWLSLVTNLTLENVTSKYPEAWGLRIQASTYVRLNNIICVHSGATNADGIHFVDSSNVIVSNVNIYTEADDGFVIEALSGDVSDYVISSLKVTSTVARGVLIFSDPNIVTGARKISNINLSSCVISNSVSSGIVFQGASFSNIHVDGVVKDCRNGLYIVPGTATYAGTMVNCRFDVLVQNVTEYGAITLTNYATYKNNTINANINNPGNNFPGVSLAGNYWSGSIVVDYNPNVDKTLFSSGVSIAGSYNKLAITSFDAGTNLSLASTATYNSFNIGTLSGATVTDLSTNASAANNNFYGGVIAGTITLNGSTTNTFSNVLGATFYGKKSLNFATLGTGDVVIAHNLKGTPSFINLTLQSSSLAGHIQPITVDATNITFRGWSASGVLVVTGTYTINLDARL